MSDLIALTREVSPAIARCELTHLPRVAIDAGRAAAQHAEYEAALAGFGCGVQRLPAGPTMADSVFIEDTAVVFDEVAVIARPGAESRRAEAAGVAEALQRHRTLARIEPPATLDGGDVLAIGRAVFVGVSSRTNLDAVEQMRRIVAPFGYHVHPIAVRGCLHLKSAVTSAAGGVLLINRRWAPAEAFAGYDLVDVHPDEQTGANILLIGDRLLYGAAFPRTRERLEKRGCAVTTVDVSEIAKAEGAVTCCSLIFRTSDFGLQTSRLQVPEAPEA